jgi:ketosteroid isomerase-like protein
VTLSGDDRLELLQLVARADNCATARDAAGYVALFTEDGAMLGAMGEAHGRAALGKAVAEVWAREPPGTLHLTLNAVVDDATPEMSVSSVMLMVAAGASPAMLGAVRVRQAVRRTADGWRITERRIEA